MEFLIKVKDILDLISFIAPISEKGALKNYDFTGIVTIQNEENGIRIIADGGRLYGTTFRTSNDINHTFISPGIITTRIIDIIQAISSFNNGDTIKISKIEQEIKISLVDDEEQFQTLPVIDKDIPFFDETEEDNKFITVSKKLFLECANKIMFAHGFELDNDRKKFRYWVLRYKSNNIRFFAGTGGIFAVSEIIDSKEMLESKKDLNILFPNQQTQAILKIILESEGDNILIKEFAPESKGMDKKMIIKSGQATMIVNGIESDVIYPDENKFLEREHNYKIITKISDWNSALKGISATDTEEARKMSGKLHTTNLHFDIKNGILNVKSEGYLKSNRKIKIIDSTTLDGSNEITFNCESKYIIDFIKAAKTDDYIEFNIFDSRSPILIKCFASNTIKDSTYERDNKILDAKEKYSIFFATYND